MRNLLQIFVLLGAFVMFFTACNVTQSVHFNRNYSGEFKIVMDMSGLLDLSSEMGETEESMEGELFQMTSEFDSAAMAKEINAIEGVSNAVVSLSDLGEIVVQYDFEDVDALNRAMEEMGSIMEDNSGQFQDPGTFLENPEMPEEEEAIVETAPLPPQFVRKGKTIIHSANSGDTPMMDGLGIEGMEMDDEDALEMASAFVDYTLIFSSDRKIKNLEVAGGLDIIQQDNNSVTMRMDMAKMLKEKGYTVNMRFK